jgi:hypothetical protein
LTQTQNIYFGRATYQSTTVSNKRPTVDLPGRRNSADAIVLHMEDVKPNPLDYRSEQLIVRPPSTQTDDTVKKETE